MLKSPRVMMYRWPVLASVMSIAMSGLLAQETASKVVEASLFKNGMAYVVREVDIPGPGSWRVSRLPNSVHGTFWILPETPGLVIQGATALQEELPTKTTEFQLKKILLLNTGKQVEVKTQSEGWLTCEVLPTSVLPPVPKENEINDNRDARSTLGYGFRGPKSTQGDSEPDYLLLKTEKGVLVVSQGDIIAIRSSSGSLITEFAGTRKESVIHIQVTSGKGKARLVCLTHGLSWAPSYIVDISNPKEAIIRSKAVIINDGEALQGVKLNLIAGYPNIQFEHAVDAFTPNLSLSDFLRGLKNRSTDSHRPAVMAQMAIMSNAAAFDSEDRIPSGSASGESREDLFLHPLPNISLKAGERGYRPLFEQPVPYRHVYVWEIGDSDDSNRQREDRPYRSSSGQGPDKEEVWHDLKLKNGGSVPWSTGPALALQDGRILGQDTMYFTASGGDTLLRITRAMDVVADRKEFEVTRERDIQTSYSGHWDLVTLKGELKVVNHKDQPVQVIIKRVVLGEISNCSMPPIIEKLAEGLKKVNQQQRLTWEVPVEARGKLNISYTYKVLVSR